MSPSQDGDDADLLIASQRDPRAFRAVYERWAEDLLKYFYRRTWDAEVAADLTAETLAVAFEKRFRFRTMGRPAGGWIYGIASRELGRFRRRRAAELRAVRRLGIEVPAVDAESTERIEALVDLAALKGALQEALVTLKPHERRALELRVLEERKYDEVAAELGCSVGAARVRVHRALARLAGVMEGER